MHGVMWGVWKERNRRLFEEKVSSKSDLIDSIMREVISWLSVVKEFQDIPPSMILHYDWVSSLKWAFPVCRKKLLSWVPPPIGSFKHNFDGASKGNPGQDGFGCVIRDHDHYVVRALCGILGVCDATKAEATSLLIEGIKSSWFERLCGKG